MKNFFKILWEDESGQGAVEYILMLVVVAAIVLTFKEKITEIIREKTGDVGNELGEVFN